MAFGSSNDCAGHDRHGAVCSSDAKRDDRDVVAGLYPDRAGKRTEPLESADSSRAWKRDQSTGYHIRIFARDLAWGWGAGGIRVRLARTGNADLRRALEQRRADRDGFSSNARLDAGRRKSHRDRKSVV